MADVAKSAVRADRDAAGGGDEGGEEEESSLSAAIESELRGVLGKSWSSGWTTVEEVLAATPPLANGHAQPLTQPLTNGHDLKPTHDLAPSPQQIAQPFDHSLETTGTDQSSQALSPSSAQDTAQVIPEASTPDSADQLHEATISDPSDQSPQTPQPNLPLKASTPDHSDHTQQNSSPDLSHLPVHTSTPDYPDLPMQNSTPDYPERPLQPSTPEQSQQTSDPDHPDVSVHKSTPGHPNLPLQKTTPDHPERPLQTSTPDDPGNTSTPDRPEPPLLTFTPDVPQKESPHDHSDHPQQTSPPDQFLITSRPEESPRAGSLDPKVASPDCPPSPPREDSLTDHSPLSDLPLTNGTQEVLHEEVRTCIESVLVEFSQEATDGTEETEITESTVIDKKKKKKTVVNGEDTVEVTTTKKKTKKSKKTEGKENISVISNGHDHLEFLPPSAMSNMEDNDLSNVCVKDLKLNYVNEANKCFNSPGKLTEVPVLPAVPIRELRRSFGDIHKACESADAPDSLESNNSDKKLRARSLGDLTRIGNHRKIDTGVNVKALAAQYWRTVSIENNLNESSPQVGRLDKSSFSKFDQLSKKTVLHVRSSDPAKAQKTFSQGAPDAQAAVLCKACQKQVFAMEQIKAERAVWHKNCFRCHTCNKQLTVDIYQSHEGLLYCKPHFRDLFQPKAVVDEEEPVRRRKPEMIIRENQPVELPPDVVRASDKPDLGLEELSSLNVKSKFQVFERQADQPDCELERSPTTVSVKRSSSIMSKLAKFQKKGMDVGVTDESLNGFVYEETSSSEEESEEGLVMNGGLSDGELNNIPFNAVSVSRQTPSQSPSESPPFITSPEDGLQKEEEDKGVIKCRRKARERPVSFGKMNDVKKNWESLNQSQRREEMREERKLELQQIRSRMWQGKQGKMKELYEQAVAESEQKGGRRESLREDEELGSLSENAKLARERFEKGEVGSGEGHESSKKELDEDMAVFEEGISKKSRNIFMEMEAAAKAGPLSPTNQPQPVARTESVRRPREAYYKQRELPQTEDIVKSSDVVDDVVIETADVSSRFKFFETYKEPQRQKKAFRITPPREGQVKTDSPEREVYRDPDVVRCDEKSEEESTILRSQTASRMLSVFRQLEEQKEVVPDGPKPKKCFTPPPDYRGSEDSNEEEGSEDEESEEEEEEEEESETEEGVVKSSYKVKDDFLEQAKNAARAKQLAAKFEQWEPEKQSSNNAINMLESEHASIESTKSLKARFESLQNEQPKEKSRPKVNRFVEQPTTALCAFCETKVYPLEKIETNGKIFHKNCFRCSYCNCILRMDTYTLNNGHLYCLPHFKQLFISKGNYDEGFGSDQHKRKWEQPLNGNTSS